MNQSDGVQELASLLEQAMTVTEITGGTDRPVELSTYRAWLAQSWNSYSLELSAATVRYRPRILDRAVEAEILDIIERELTDHIHDRRVHFFGFVLYGGDSAGLQLVNILGRLLDFTIVHGPQQAARAFYGATQATHATFEWRGLIAGATIDQEMHPAPGMRIIPVPPNHLPQHLPSHLPYAPVFPERKTLIAITGRITPVFVNPSRLDLTEGMGNLMEVFSMTPESPDSEIDRFCEALALASGAFVGCAARWIHRPNDELFGHDMAWAPGTGSVGVGYNPTLLGHFPDTNLSEPIVRSALLIYEARQQLDDDTGKKLDVPIARWVRSKQGRGDVDAFIDIGIALESLYLSDQGTAELRHRLALRAAWHLGASVEDRKAIMGDMRKIYSLRSRAVHSGVVPSTEATTRLRTRAEQLALTAIRKVIERGSFPDWERIVLGG